MVCWIKIVKGMASKKKIHKLIKLNKKSGLIKVWRRQELSYLASVRYLGCCSSSLISSDKFMIKMD